MKLVSSHDAIVNFLKSKSNVLGVPIENIRKGIVGDYATNFPSILTHLLPNNEGEMYSTGNFENNWTLQVAVFNEGEDDLYNISEIMIELVCENLHPYDCDFIDIVAENGKGYIVYEFKLFHNFIRE